MIKVLPASGDPPYQITLGYGLDLLESNRVYWNEDRTCLIEYPAMAQPVIGSIGHAILKAIPVKKSKFGGKS